MKWRSDFRGHTGDYDWMREHRPRRFTLWHLIALALVLWLLCGAPLPW